MFQFYCPQGHLLEAEPSQSGQQCACPTCGAAFVIPSPAPTQSGPVSETAMAAQYDPAGSSEIAAEDAPSMNVPQQNFPPQGYGPSETFPHVAGGDGAAQFPSVTMGPSVGPPGGQNAGTGAEVPDFSASPKDDPNRVIRIICPEGHELQTPMDMVGTDAMCPHCSTQFRLRYEDSLEYKEEREQQRLRREEAFGQGALKWAIVAAVLVILGLVGLMVLKAVS